MFVIDEKQLHERNITILVYAARPEGTVLDGSSSMMIVRAHYMGESSNDFAPKHSRRRLLGEAKAWGEDPRSKEAPLLFGKPLEVALPHSVQWRGCRATADGDSIYPRGAHFLARSYGRWFVVIQALLASEKGKASAEQVIRSLRDLDDGD